MPVAFSDHEKFQLKKRKISQKLARKAVQESIEIIPSFRGRKLRRLLIDDKMLEVVTRTEGSRITIVTAYYLEEDL